MKGMKPRHFAIPILLIIAAASAAAIGLFLVRCYSCQELTELSSGIQIVIFMFTASAGLLALIKYWGSVEAELEHKRWEKMNHLQTCYQQFREKHLDVIQAFDYSHILREIYLPLCDKAIVYDKTEPNKQASVMTLDDMKRVRQLDDFLEFFENLFFAISHHLVGVNDVLVFLRYYIFLLGNSYYDPNDKRLKTYINQYYYNIVPLLDLVEQEVKSVKKHAINQNFANFPRR